MDKVAYYKEQIYKEAGILSTVGEAVGKGLGETFGLARNIKNGAGVVNSLKSMSTAGKVTTGALGLGAAKLGSNLIRPKQQIPQPSVQEYM